VTNNLSRTVSFLVCILACVAVSWVSIYAFWFAVWTFHNVDAARTADFIGSAILFPARWILERFSYDETILLQTPVVYAGGNGLILGTVLYSLYRTVALKNEASRELKQQATHNGQAPRQPVGQKIG
jgi:hypothetical protein